MSNNTLLDTAKGDVVSITMQTIAASTIIAPTISLTTSTVLVNNIAATTNISAGGNIAATGSISATGNVVSVTGNVTAGGNVVATGNVTASGSISAVGNVVVGGLVRNSVNGNIASAQTTNLFTSAVSITSQINVVNTVAVGASTAAPFALPSVAVALGAPITMFNQSTRTLAVWPQPLDIIDIAATGTAVLIDAGKRADFFPVATTAWISAQYGTTSV